MSLRPTTLAEYVGQKDVLNNLEVFIKAAFETVLQVQPTQEEVAACREMLGKSVAVLASKQHPHRVIITPWPRDVAPVWRVWTVEGSDK